MAGFVRQLRMLMVVGLGYALWAAPVQAGCGCQKAPPDLSNVRPNATYAGTQVTLFSASFQAGQTYSVDFVSGTTGATATVSATAANRRDLADAVYKPQLSVVLPSMPLGPTSIRVRTATATVLSVNDNAFTVVPQPIAVTQDVGSSSYPNFRAAIGRDGTFYISLDMSAVRLPRVFRAQAKGYPLTFTSNDVVFDNIQGFQMQLLTGAMPGLYSIVSPNGGVDSDILGYSRHEFNTFYLQHGERQAHQVIDGSWHTDGTRHVDHDHLVLAINGVLTNGTVPAPGATPPFTLALETFTLFHDGLIGVQEVRLRNDALVDSYDSVEGSFGREGDVASNGQVVLEDRGVVDGDATARSVVVTDTAVVTGMVTQSNTPRGFMPVQVPDGLPDLGAIVVLENQSRTIEPGSYRASQILLDKNGILNINNSTGPVTLYVTGMVEGRGDQSLITTADPDPEKFALYVVGGNKVEFRNGGSFYGVVYAPQSYVEIRNSGEFFGSFVGDKVMLRNLAQVHYDTALRGRPAAAPTTTATPTPTWTPIPAATFTATVRPTSTPIGGAPAATGTSAPASTPIATATKAPTCAVNPSGTYIDAEKFSGRANAGTTYSFAGVSSAQSGFVGTGYLKTGATQNQMSFSDVNAAPASYERYDYRLNFPTAGTYTVWIRGWSADSNQNSIYIGLDGTAVGALTELTYGAWVWTNSIYNGTNTITVTTSGVHTVNLWPREYNHLLDGFYLTTTATVPSGGIPSGATVYGQGCSG